jgi:hypothetical protein
MLTSIGAGSGAATTPAAAHSTRQGRDSYCPGHHESTVTERACLDRYSMQLAGQQEQQRSQLVQLLRPMLHTGATL